MSTRNYIGSSHLSTILGPFVGMLSPVRPPMLITMTCCMVKIGSLNIEGKGEPQFQAGELG